MHNINDWQVCKQKMMLSELIVHRGMSGTNSGQSVEKVTHTHTYTHTHTHTQTKMTATKHTHTHTHTHTQTKMTATKHTHTHTHRWTL